MNSSNLEKKINYITLKTQTTLILCYRHYGPLTLKHGPLTLKSIKVNISLSTDIMEFSNQTISYWGFIIFDIPLYSHFKVLFNSKFSYIQGNIHIMID